MSKTNNFENKFENKEEIIKAKNIHIDELTSEIEILRKIICQQETKIKEGEDNIDTKTSEYNHFGETEIEIEEEKSESEHESEIDSYIESIDSKSVAKAQINALTALNVIVDDLHVEEPLEEIKKTDKVDKSDKADKTDKIDKTNKVDNIVKKDNQNNKTENNIVKKEIINDWDDDSNKTLNNWYNTFREISHIYQFILDRNYKISSKLSLISIISSSSLSIFAGFKLWVPDDKTFQNSSNIIMLISNLVIAGITTMSKRYIDDNRNEKIRTYIEEVDQFMNLVYAQYCLLPVYRLNAKEFFKSNNDQYTKLMVSAPNLSINELEIAKTNYKIYKKTYQNDNV
jgi:hypothetical protein